VQIGDASIAMRHEQMEMGMDLDTANGRQRTNNHGEGSAYAQSRRRNSRGNERRHHEERREKPMQRERDGSITDRDNGYRGTLLNQEIFGAVAPRPGPCK
jgi:hypothetical protein